MNKSVIVFLVSAIFIDVFSVCFARVVINIDYDDSDLSGNKTFAYPEKFLAAIKAYPESTRQATNISTPSVVTNITSAVSNVVSRIPCSCASGQCSCCSGRILQYINQKACVNVLYEPDEFAFTASLTLNERVFWKNRITGKSPPPICFRLPRFRAITVCVEFSNVYFPGANLHACVDLEASWEDFTIFETSFDCFRIGAGGVAIVRPEDGGGIGSVIDEEDDDDDYDDSA